MNNKEKQAEFERLSVELINFLRVNFHPHTHITIDSNQAELSEGLMVVEHAK